MHGSTIRRVKVSVKLCLAGVLFWSLPLLAADADMSRLLKKIETRYNSTRTLQVQFQETYTQMGRKRVEAGDLFLRKPGANALAVHESGR